jgi:hypothetical protein
MYFLNQFSEKELNYFELFLRSRYFNSYETVILLFEYLKTLYPRITSKDISPYKISLKIYGEKEVNEAKIRKLLSDFGGLADKFFIQTELEKSSSLRNGLLLKAFREKDLRNKYRSLLKKMRRPSEISFKEKEGAYADMFRIEEENFDYQHALNDKRITAAYEKKTEMLDYFIVHKKLKNYYDYIISEAYLTKNDKVEKLFFAEVLGFVEANLSGIKRHHPFIYLYYLLTQFYRNYEVKYLNELTEYYEISYKKFSSELFYAFNKAIISAYLKMRSKRIGDVEYYNEKLFKINDNIFMKNPNDFGKYFGNIPFRSHNFLSVAEIALSLGKSAWTKKFIDKYKNSMKDEFREDCYNIVLMKYNYLIKNYEEAVSYGIKVSGKFPNYYYTTRILIIRAYYELSDQKMMHTFFENLKQYLKRKKNLNDFDQNRLKTFLIFFSKFIRVMESITDKKLIADRRAELLSEIEKLSNTLDSRKWFLEKLG